MEMDDVYRDVLDVKSLICDDVVFGLDFECES